MLAVYRHRQLELAVVVGQLTFRHAVGTRVNLEAERVPAPFSRVSKLRAHRDDCAGADEERERLELGLVRAPARAVESPIGPEVVPAAGPSIDVAPAARYGHRGDEQVRAEAV